MNLLRILSCLALTYIIGVSCTSASREGLPPDSPFAEISTTKETMLPYGTAVGDVTSRSAVLWLRTDGLRAVQIGWASVEDWKKQPSVQSAASRTPVIVTGPYTDFTLSILLEGLAPATRYRYHI